MILWRQRDLDSAWQQSVWDPHHHLLCAADTPWSTTNERELKGEEWIYKSNLPQPFAGYYSVVAASLHLLEWNIWDWMRKLHRPNPDVIHIRTFSTLACDFIYATSDRCAEMLQNEAYYCIGFLMKEDQQSSDSFPRTRDRSFLVGKLTGMFAMLKVSTKHKLTMLSNQVILRGFVRGALETLRDVENHQYKDEEVLEHAAARCERPVAASSGDHPVVASLITSILEGASVLSLEQDQKLNAASSEPTQGKPPEPPEGAETAKSAPALTLATNLELMATAQLALDAYWGCHSGCTCGGLLCEHFQEIYLLWQRLESCRKGVESSLIYTNEYVSALDETHGSSQCSAVAKLETQTAHPSTQRMPKGNLPAVPAANDSNCGVEGGDRGDEALAVAGSHAVIVGASVTWAILYPRTTPVMIKLMHQWKLMTGRDCNELRMAWVMTYLLPVIATRWFSPRLRTSDNGNCVTDR